MGLPSITSYPLPSDADLPTARATWQLTQSRAAVLVHDMQNYFCAPYSTDQAPLSGVVTHIAKLITSARKVGIPVVYTAQNGDQFRPDRGLQADLWGPGMKHKPEHQDILETLRPAPADIVLVKHRYSAFQRSNLADLLRARGRDQLVITGVYAHIGCLATAADAFQRDIQPFAIADAQADFDRTRHDMAMTWIAGCCGGVMTTADALKAIQGPRV